MFPVGEVTVDIYSGDVTFASDDVCRSKAHKWSGQAVLNFEIRVIIGVSQLTSAVEVQHQGLWSLHHVAPINIHIWSLQYMSIKVC